MTLQRVVPALWRRYRRPLPRLVVGALLCGAIACGDLVGTATLPPGTLSPNTYNTPDGALGAYRGVISNLQTALPQVIVRSGALTDELTYKELGRTLGNIGAVGDPVDERMLDAQSSEVSNPYGNLQTVRGTAAEAIGLLANYAPNVSPALRGEMYTLEGYAELTLAELYCSGVPLSTLDFQGDFTYKPGSTEEEVYTHAITLFDSALAISADSTSVMALASVEKGRALLDLGQYTQAGQAVADVPTTFRDTLPVQFFSGVNYTFYDWSVATDEGMNGLPFGSGTDPRVPVQSVSSDTNQFGVPHVTPLQYPAPGVSPVVIASGIEARLIEAEAALHSGNTDWLTILNTLRTTCTDSATCPSPAPAGTGGVAGLPPLSDPGSDSARVTMLFSERAYWLFLTGHRQGDLRRLVRNYGRSQSAVYPTGVYYGGYGSYGTAVSLPIPSSEDVNPLFHGCLDLGA